MQGIHSWPQTTSPNPVLTGIKDIDRITGGAKPGDIWALAGEPSSGKSFLMCRCCLGATSLGFRALFLSLKMTNSQVGGRILPMLAQVNATHMRLGRLSHFSVQQVHKRLEEWKSKGDPGRLSLLDGRIDMSVEDVLLAIQGHKPEIVFIDGTEMLLPALANPGSRRERIEAVVEQLKCTATTTNVPIFCSFQAEQRTNEDNDFLYTPTVRFLSTYSTVMLLLSNEELHNSAISDRHDGISYKRVEIYRDNSINTRSVRMRYDMNLTRIEQDIEC